MTRRQKVVIPVISALVLLLAAAWAAGLLPLGGPRPSAGDVAESPKLAIDPVRTEKAIAWLQDYYIKYPVGGGWRVANVLAIGDNIYIDVILPQNQFNSVKALPWERQFSIIHVACPSRREEVWNIYDPNQSISVRASGSAVRGAIPDVEC